MTNWALFNATQYQYSIQVLSFTNTTVSTTNLHDNDHVSIICDDGVWYRRLHGQAPRYLADHLIPASDAAPTRTVSLCLAVNSVRCSTTLA